MLRYTFGQNMLLLLAFALAIVVAMVFHEAAHAYAAYKQGDPTAKMMGRLSLNPAKHFDPLGLLSFAFIGFGWAKPVPVNPFNYKNFRRGNFWVSISGVLVNLVLGFLFSLGYVLMFRFAGFYDLGNFDGNLFIWFLGWFFMLGMILNIGLMIFNMLPIPPLDGGHLVFLTYEGIFRRPPNEMIQVILSYAGLLLILLLMIWTVSLDLAWVTRW